MSDVLNAPPVRLEGVTVNPNQIPDFTNWAQKNNIDLTVPGAMERALKAYFGGGYLDDAKPMKDVVGAPPVDGWLYDNGPFTWHVESVLSDVMNAGSRLLQWIPVSTLDYKEEHVAHLSFIIPEGWNGSDYAAWLAANGYGECDYGPADEWYGFEYMIPYGEWSFTTRVLKPEHSGFNLSARSARYYLRGNRQGMRIDNDAEFALSRLGFRIQQHESWNIVHGAYGGNHQWDGVLQILTTGYVTSHMVGTNTPTWSDPLVIDGTSLTTCTDVLMAIRGAVRVLRNRIASRNFTLADGDMAVVMPMPMWAQLLDCIACGGLTGCGSAPANVTGTVADVRYERNLAAMQGIEIDGVRVPVIPENSLGVSALNAGQPQVVGDILILTRRMNGMNLWENQHLNWDALGDQWRMAMPNTTTDYGGLVRVGWVAENQKCYKYFAEAKGRLVCYALPMQARITNVTMDIDRTEEMESGLPVADFYADVTVLNP